MAISYVGGQVAGRTNASAASQITFALTGGSNSTPSAGDLVIVTCVAGTLAGNPAMAVTTPNDYTALGQLNQSAATNDTSMDVSYKIMGGTPDTTVTVPGTTSNSWAEAYCIQVFRGVNPANPMDVTPVADGGTATGRPNPAQIDWTTAGTWVYIAGGGAAATGATYTAPANYTTNFRTANGTDNVDAMVGCGYNSSPSDPENPAAYTGGTTNAADSWCSYTLALRPLVIKDAAASLSGEGTLSASAINVSPVSANLSGEATLSASAIGVNFASCTLEGEAVLTATAEKVAATKDAAASLSGEATFTASASYRRQLRVWRGPMPGILRRSALLDLYKFADFIKQTSASFLGEATLVASAEKVTGIKDAAATLSGEATLTASATLSKYRTANLSGEATLTTSTLLSKYRTVNLSGEGTLTTSALLAKFRTVDISGEATFSAIAKGSYIRSVNLSGEAILSASAVKGTTRDAAASLSGEATLVATALRDAYLSANLSGQATLTANAVKHIFRAATLSGEAELIITVKGNYIRNVNLQGQAIMTATAIVFGQIPEIPSGSMYAGIGNNYTNATLNNSALIASSPNNRRLRAND